MLQGVTESANRTPWTLHPLVNVAIPLVFWTPALKQVLLGRLGAWRIVVRLKTILLGAGMNLKLTGPCILSWTHRILLPPLITFGIMFLLLGTIRLRLQTMLLGSMYLPSSKRTRRALTKLDLLKRTQPTPFSLG